MKPWRNYREYCCFPFNGHLIKAQLMAGMIISFFLFPECAEDSKTGVILTNAIAFLKVKGTVYRHKIDHKLDTVNLKTNYFAVVLLICKLVRILLVQACKRSLLPKLNGWSSFLRQSHTTFVLFLFVINWMERVGYLTAREVLLLFL